MQPEPELPPLPRLFGSDAGRNMQGSDGQVSKLRASVRQDSMRDVLKRIWRRHAAICTVLLLAGCASAAPPTTFDLDPAITIDHAKQSRHQLAIVEPTTTQPLASHRILIRTGPDTIAYLRGGQWSTELPRLVQDRLIDGFESAHVLRAVGGEAFVADLSLHTDIAHFEFDVGHGEAVVEIDAKLIDAKGRVVAEKIFTTRAPGANDHVPTVAAALNAAFAQAVHDIVMWAATRA